MPEKYRFLLFEDKREVELVWNGKASEVCNIVLPFQVIEQVDEPRAEKTSDTTRQLSLFDLNFESKREIIRVKNDDNGEWEEQWTGDYIFENEWQSFRTKKDRSLELKSIFHECAPGRRKIAVKVMDIFGNDTMTIVDVSV